MMLQNFNFKRFLAAIENGIILVDFDAKTTHNHDTKFRMKPNMWPHFYENETQVF